MAGVPKDRGWAWVVLIGYFCSSVVLVGIAKTFGVLLLQFKITFDTDTARASLAMGISGITYTFLAPFAMLLGEQYTQRKVVMIGAVVSCLLISLSSLMYSIDYVNFMYGIGTGIADACIFGNGLVMLGHYFSKYRSLSNGLGSSGSSIGTFTIPPLLQFCLDTFGVNGTLLLIGAIYLNICVCGALYRPTSFYEKMYKEETKMPDTGDIVKDDFENAEAGDSLLKHSGAARITSTGSMMMGSMESLHVHAETYSKSPSKDERESRSVVIKRFFFERVFPVQILKLRVVVFFVCVSFCLFVGYFNFIIFMPVDLHSRGIHGYDKALLISIAGIGDLIGRITAGVVGNLEFVQRYKIMAFCCIVSGIQILIFAFATEYWWMAIHVGLYGLLGGGYVALIALVVIDFVGLALMPKALGVVLFIQGVGATIGQPIEGFLNDYTGSFLAVNILNSCCMIVGGLILFLYPLVKTDAQDEVKENGLQIVMDITEVNHDNTKHDENQ